MQRFERMSIVLPPYLQQMKGVKKKTPKTPLHRIDSTPSVLAGEFEIKKKRANPWNRPN